MKKVVCIIAALCVAACQNLTAAEAPRSDDPIAELLTPDAEHAIDRALAYLARTQRDDGSWSSHPVAMTGLSILAFMVRGHQPGIGEYGENLTKAVDFLLKESHGSDGYMGGSMYEHAYATLALAEVWGMSDQEEVGKALKAAVRVIINAQDTHGGWRYQPRPSGGDGSVVVTQMVALAAAREAGIFVPDSTIEKAIGFTKALQERRTGGFGYTGPVGPTLSTTACGVTCLIYAGEDDSPEVRHGLEFMMDLEEDKFEVGGGVRWFHYAHYYAILATYQAGESYYTYWYPRIRDQLVQTQREEGGWGTGYVTPMTVLTLGSATRFLPIHQR